MDGKAKTMADCYSKCINQEQLKGVGMSIKESPEVFGIKAILELTGDKAKSFGREFGLNKLKGFAVGLIRNVQEAVMSYGIRDPRVREKFTELLKNGKETTEIPENILEMFGLGEAAVASGLLKLDGVDAVKLSKVFEGANAVDLGKEMGLLLSNIVLLGAAWGSVEIDDKIAASEKEREIYEKNLQQAALTTSMIMHGQKPIPMDKAMEYAKTAFPDVRAEHLESLVKKMEHEREVQMAAKTLTPNVDVNGFREKKESSEISQTATARSNVPAV